MADHRCADCGARADDRWEFLPGWWDWFCEPCLQARWDEAEREHLDDPDYSPYAR